jgi:hypothetical protein
MTAAVVSSIAWDITRRGGLTQVTFRGSLDERANLDPLRIALIGRVMFRLQDIERINSMGVHKWIGFMRSLPAITDLVLIHCSYPFVQQMNLTYGFAGNARVESFYAPYACEHCLREQTRLIANDASIEEPQQLLSSVACPGCGHTMQLDEHPDRYLLFRRYTPTEAPATQ